MADVDMNVAENEENGEIMASVNRLTFIMSAILILQVVKFVTDIVIK